MHADSMDKAAEGERRCETILVVEDDEDIRTALQYVLEDEGYPTALASNGQEALDQLRTTTRPA